MKKRSMTYLFVTVLLLFATVFSVLLTPVHTDDCEHSVCEYCKEVAAVEQAVNATLEEHNECMETACETCVFIKKQIEQLEQQRTAEHSCHEVICDDCARMALGRRLRLVVCVLAIFVLVYATTRAICLLIKEKMPTNRAFTLFALKVRLND